MASAGIPRLSQPPTSPLFRRKHLLRKASDSRTTGPCPPPPPVRGKQVIPSLLAEEEGRTERGGRSPGLNRPKVKNERETTTGGKKEGSTRMNVCVCMLVCICGWVGGERHTFLKKSTIYINNNSSKVFLHNGFFSFVIMFFATDSSMYQLYSIANLYINLTLLLKSSQRQFAF